MTSTYNNSQQSNEIEISELVQRYSEEKKLRATVNVPPHSMRYNLTHVIQDRLSRNIRGKCNDHDGFILQLKRIENIDGGILDKRSGAAQYGVDFIAQILRPKTGDVVEAVVSRIFKIGVFADLGPLEIFIPLARMSSMFVFQSAPSPQFVVFEKSTDNKIDVNQSIRIGTEVQIRIEKIAMLDDNFSPSNSKCCVLKSMGELVGVQSSLKTQKQQRRTEFISL